MTLKCYKFKFSRNFALRRIFVRPIYQGCRALTFALLGIPVVLRDEVYQVLTEMTQFDDTIL